MRKISTISKILQLKDGKKQEIEIEVKKAADNVDEEKSKLRSLEKEYHETLKVFNDGNEKGTLNVDKINSYYDYFARIDGKIKAQRELHFKRTEEFKIIKDALINAHKDKKIFEILKDKALKENHKERELSDRKEADYMVLARKFR